MTGKAIQAALWQGALVALLVVAVPRSAAWAQEGGIPAVRAANMARMTAERLNGGLQEYRAAACMYQQGGGACLLRKTAQGFTFLFLGGPPGWQQLGLAPTVETELLVAPYGGSVTKVIYNGPPRQGQP
jgi:hypothetical protein